MKRVSEVVTMDKVKSWKSGDIITISAGTGMGKSFFIKTHLYAHAKLHNKKILFLIHRTNCVNQFQKEIERDKKTDAIEIRTYQSIETIIKNGGSFDFSSYQYIVSDEFHYWMSDAAFSKYTDLSLKAVLDANNAIRIFMSATGDYMKRFINNFEKIKTIDYEIPVNFNFIKKLVFFNKDDSLEKFIKIAIEKNIKTVFFIQSAKKAYELHKKFKDVSLFNCSKFNKEYYKYVDETAINEMLENERFEKLILITTTTMDAGVNIIDDQLKHIVCDVKDVGTLIQCIGRKRLQNKGDCIELYIKSISNQQLGGLETQLSKRIKMAQFLRKHTPEDFVKEFPRESDYTGIVYDDVIEGEKDRITKKVNYLMYSKNIIDIAEVDIMKNHGDFGYCKCLARKFGFYDGLNDHYDYIILDEEEKNNELSTYLDNNVGQVMLTLKDRKELIEKVNVKQGRKLLKSLDSLNSALRERNIDYYIKQFETSRMIDGKKKKFKSAWKVMKMVD